MRIQKMSTEARQETAKSKGNPAKDDRFSKILEERRKESMPQLKTTAEGQGFDLPPTASQPQRVFSTPASTDIERLISEIVDHISSHQADGTRSVEIQFNSRTFEGLRVSVQSQQGSIAINFMTPLARDADLVQKNLSSLRSALETKGIRLAQLAVHR